MRVLVTGSTGQLGYDVVRQGKKEGLDMIGIGSRDLDITDKEAVYHYLDHLQPDAIIHCAAYTAVDNAEDEKEVCRSINVNGTRNLVEAAAKGNKAKFMYISTDYVFDGDGKEPFKETDKPNPIGYYGKTKLEGERIVQDILKNWFIVRVSWVFGINGNNFVKTMLRLSETNEEVNVVSDQIGSPSYTYDLACLLIDMIKSNKYGIFHATNEGFCSWAEFAKEIYRQAGIDTKVNAIPTEKYPTRAVRPKNSRLEKRNIVDKGFNLLPSWQDAVKRFLAELKSGGEIID